MAAKKAKATVYTVEVVGKPAYCGIGAAGVQFANGSAKVTDEWVAEWYRTHEGYKVTAEAAEAPEEETEAKK